MSKRGQEVCVKNPEDGRTPPLCNALGAAVFIALCLGWTPEQIEEAMDKSELALSQRKRPKEGE